MSNLPSSRSQAIALGLSRYFTGKPCKHGHVCERAVTYGCVSCSAAAKRVWVKTPTGRASKARHKKNWLKTEAGKKKNQERMRLRSALGKDRKTTWYKRTPKWADTKAILQFIDTRPDGFELDHIIPIRGETVSGLHVLENLQFIPAPENRAKSNRVIPETLEAAVCPMPHHYFAKIEATP